MIHILYLHQVEQLRESEMGTIPTLTFHVFRSSLVPSPPRASSGEEPHIGMLSFRLEPMLRQMAVISVLRFARRIYVPYIRKADPRFLCPQGGSLIFSRSVDGSSRFICPLGRPFCLIFHQTDTHLSLMIDEADPCVTLLASWISLVIEVLTSSSRRSFSSSHHPCELTASLQSVGSGSHSTCLATISISS